MCIYNIYLNRLFSVFTVGFFPFNRFGEVAWTLINQPLILTSRIVQVLFYRPGNGNLGLACLGRSYVLSKHWLYTILIIF